MVKPLEELLQLSISIIKTILLLLMNHSFKKRVIRGIYGLRLVKLGFLIRPRKAASTRSFMMP